MATSLIRNDDKNKIVELLGGGFVVVDDVVLLVGNALQLFSNFSNFLSSPTQKFEELYR